MNDNENDQWKDYVLSPSGIKIDFLNPKPDQIDVHDIAYNLAGIQRFSGGCKPRYTVGQHSIACAKVVLSTDNKLLLSLLLHDAEEYVFGDLATPIKQYVPDFSKLAIRLRYAILEKYGVLETYKRNIDLIKEVDFKMYRTECQKLRNHPKEDIYENLVLTYQHPKVTEQKFLELFHALKLRTN
jgi:uncharacterized protein